MENTREWFVKNRDLYVYKLECPCANCGNKATHLHHIVQLSKGGTNLDSNIIQLCQPCHELIHNVKFFKREKMTFNDLPLDFEHYYGMWANNEITKLEFMDCINVKRYKTINKYINLFEAELERRWAEEDKMKVN